MKENVSNNQRNSNSFSSEISLTETNTTNYNSSSDLSIDQVAVNVNYNEPDDTRLESASQISKLNKKKDGIFKWLLKRPYVKKNIVKIIAITLFHIYLIYATYYNYSHENQWNFCEGLGFLLILVAFTYLYIIYSVILKQCSAKILKVKVHLNNFYSCRPWIGKLVYVLVVIGIILFLAFDTHNDRRRLVSAGGILGLILIAFIFSKHPKQINWRQVTWGLVLQFVFGLGILRWKPGRLFFECIGSKVDIFLSFTDAGSSFIYGALITQKPFLPQRLPNDSIAFNVTLMVNQYQAVPVVVVFKALSVIYFFSFVISMLFYLGYIQTITLQIGTLLRRTIGTSNVESVSAAANIFLGQAMTPLLIAPYIKDLTLSELHAVITGGFATIAGTTMAAYIRYTCRNIIKL